MLTLSLIKLVLVVVIGVLSAKLANSFHTSGCISDSISKSVILYSYTSTNESFRKPFTQLHQSMRESHEPISNVLALTRRNAMVATLVVLSTSASPSQRAYADVSDGNSLPKGAQQFARTIKLKTDIKDVVKRLLTASEDNMIDKTEWDNISKFLRTVYSTAENDMKDIAKGLTYNPSNQERAYRDVDEIKKYSQAGDVSVSKQDTARLASILSKVAELLDDFLSSLSDVPDEI